MWTEQYRPTSFDDFVFQDDVTKLHILKFLETKDIPHLLFSGPPGTGKTSCAFLLIKEIGIEPIDTLIINASKENSAETVRTKIDGFCSVAALDSPYKVVILEEADYLSQNAQAILRRLCEEQYASVRFILTCNHPNKLRDAINSRMQHFTFHTLPEDVIATRVVQILDTEGVKWDPADVSRIIQASPHDLRKIINMLEQYTVQGELFLPTSLSRDGNTHAQVIEMMAADQWNEIRALVATGVSDDQIVEMMRTIYTNLHVSPKFTKSQDDAESAILTIAEYLHRSATVADQFINFAAMLIELKRI